MDPELVRELATQHCTPCERGGSRLAGEALSSLLHDLGAGWNVVDGHHLEKEYSFADFRQALAFTVRVGELAESEGHHPSIHLAWGVVRITIWTYKVDGLTPADFILASKIEREHARPG